MNLAAATRQDLPVSLAGKTYSLPVRTLQELGPLQAWFLREIPSPLTRALTSLAQCDRQAVPLAPVLRQTLLDLALRHERRWPPAPGTRDWLAAVEDRDQIGWLVRWGLAPRHPELTLDQADAIVREAAVEELAVFCRALFEGRLPDPKSPAPGPETNPPATTTTTTNPGPPPATTGDR